MRLCSMAVQSIGFGCSSNIHNHFGVGQGGLGTDNTTFPKNRCDLFLLEIGQARIRRAEVRPICNRRAISALLTPVRYSFRTWPAWSPAVMGRPSVLPFCRA